MGCHSGDREQDRSENSRLESIERENDNIIVYGSNTCPHCLVIMRKLEEEEIPFLFKDVDKNDTDFQEMYDKIRKINYQGYVNYPVVDVKGTILVAPGYEQVEEVMARYDN
jgi:glutaredoxin